MKKIFVLLLGFITFGFSFVSANVVTYTPTISHYLLFTFSSGALGFLFILLILLVFSKLWDKYEGFQDILKQSRYFSVGILVLMGIYSLYHPMRAYYILSPGLITYLLYIAGSAVLIFGTSFLYRKFGAGLLKKVAGLLFGFILVLIILFDFYFVFMASFIFYILLIPTVSVLGSTIKLGKRGFFDGSFKKIFVFGTVVFLMVSSLMVFQDVLKRDYGYSPGGARGFHPTDHCLYLCPERFQEEENSIEQAPDSYLEISVYLTWFWTI